MIRRGDRARATGQLPGAIVHYNAAAKALGNGSWAPLVIDLVATRVTTLQIDLSLNRLRASVPRGSKPKQVFDLVALAKRFDALEAPAKALKTRQRARPFPALVSTCEALGIGAGMILRLMQLLRRAEVDFARACDAMALLISRTRTATKALESQLKALQEAPSSLRSRVDLLDTELFLLGSRIRSKKAPISVARVSRHAALPVALRGRPRGHEAPGVPLRTAAGLRKLSVLLGPRRTVLVISACHRDRRWMKALSKLAVDYRHIGLAVGATAVRTCKRQRDERGYWLGGAELPWALEAPPDSVVVFDAKGAVLWRQKLRNIAHAGDVVRAWLVRRWPAFARAQRHGAPPQPPALVRQLAHLERRLIVERNANGAVRSRWPSARRRSPRGRPRYSSGWR
jgi:hypothetical protein